MCVYVSQYIYCYVRVRRGITKQIEVSLGWSEKDPKIGVVGRDQEQLE